MVIIDHFDKYPLITQKLADYNLFKQAFELFKSKQHLTEKGLREIVALRASINRGLSETLKIYFPDVVPVQRPVIDQVVKDPNWLAGFVDGEGCFFINIRSSEAHKTGKQVALRFQITQHGRDEQLMRSLVNYLDCGNATVRSDNTAIDFVVTKFSDIENKIIPFFVLHWKISYSWS